jgi:broad specificity phosphatase PhoE
MRHGETVTNAKGLVTGAQYVPLTPGGANDAWQQFR